MRHPSEGLRRRVSGEKNASDLALPCRAETGFVPATPTLARWRNFVLGVCSGFSKCSSVHPASRRSTEVVPVVERSTTNQLCVVTISGPSDQPSSSAPQSGSKQGAQVPGHRQKGLTRGRLHPVGMGFHGPNRTTYGYNGASGQY